MLNYEACGGTVEIGSDCEQIGGRLRRQFQADLLLQPPKHRYTCHYSDAKKLFDISFSLSQSNGRIRTSYRSVHTGQDRQVQNRTRNRADTQPPGSSEGVRVLSIS